MTTERKVLVLDQAAVSDAGAGTGYGAVFGNRDEGGDTIQPGFFEPVLAEFLHDGFIGWGHNWHTPVAWPTAAAEDLHGLDLAWQYHSTAGAQEARTITAERLAARKSMGLSIGYEVAEERTDGAGGRLLLKAARLFEVSLVLVPMNRLAGVRQAKALAATAGALPAHDTATSDDAWDAAAAEAALAGADADAVRAASAWQDPDADPDSAAAYKYLHHFVGADGAVGAASTAACTAAIAMLNAGREAGIPDSDRAGVYRHLAAHLAGDAAPLKGLPDGLTYAGESSRVLADLVAWGERTRDLLTKEGRAISSARRDRLAGHVTALEAVLDDLRGLLAETTPPEKATVWAMRARVRLAQARAEFDLATP